MSTFRNGDIPESLLIRRGVIRLTAGTWAKWDRLVEIVKRRHGVTLTITQGTGVTLGSGGYRDRAMQRAVKKKYVALGRPWQAADEGTSSHGGEFNGEDALAVDVNNYFRISQAEFFAAAREAGFVAGYFNGKGGRPKEPWHLIDKDPYRAVSAAGGATKPIPAPVPADLMEAIRMAQIRYVHRIPEKNLPTEWMIVGLEIPGGFQVTTDEEEAVGWGAVYGTDDGDSWKGLNRQTYIKLQQSARDLHLSWVALQKQIHAGRE